jgi:predicted nucleotidyltransferase
MAPPARLPFESTLRELFGGELRYRVLRALFEEPGRELHLRGLAAAAAVDSGNAHRILKKLVEAGICEQVADVPYSKYRARQDNPYYPELARLFSRGRNLIEAIREVAQGLDGTVAIYGSVARGEDRPQSDIDVLVIGPVSTIMAQAAFKPVARAHNRRINANAVTEADLVSQLEAGSAFWRDVLSGPLIKLKGDIPHEVARRLREAAQRRVPAKGRRPARHP